jgi:hypothetical protein
METHALRLLFPLHGLEQKLPRLKVLSSGAGVEGF